MKWNLEKYYFYDWSMILERIINIYLIFTIFYHIKMIIGWTLYEQRIIRSEQPFRHFQNYVISIVSGNIDKKWIKWNSYIISWLHFHNNHSFLLILICLVDINSYSTFFTKMRKIRKSLLSKFIDSHREELPKF